MDQPDVKGIAPTTPTPPLCNVYHEDVKSKQIPKLVLLDVVPSGRDRAGSVECFVHKPPHVVQSETGSVLPTYGCSH